VAQRVNGTITALSDASVTLANADGTSATIALMPGRTVTLTAPITVDQIQPGSHVATANKTQADGSGVSTEIRVFPPEIAPADVNRIMDQADPATIMTNGRVATAVSSDGGRRLTVDYGTGSRQITVPPAITVVSNMPGTADMVKVGRKVTVATFPPAGERPAPTPTARSTISSRWRATGRRRRTPTRPLVRSRRG
jgi:hypothetical protein